MQKKQSLTQAKFVDFNIDKNDYDVPSFLQKHNKTSAVVPQVTESATIKAVAQNKSLQPVAIVDDAQLEREAKTIESVREIIKTFNMTHIKIATLNELSLTQSDNNKT